MSDYEPCAICGSRSYFYFDRDGEEYNCPEPGCPKKPLAWADETGPPVDPKERKAV